MQSLYNFITEKFKINSKTAKKTRNLEDWSIENAEDGDFVNWNSTELYFIYKCLNGELEEPLNNRLGPDTIIYHAAYNFNLEKLDIGPDTGVSDIKHPKNFTLASEEKKEAFIKVLKDNGYEWDEYKKELIKK